MPSSVWLAADDAHHDAQRRYGELVRSVDEDHRVVPPYQGRPFGQSYRTRLATATHAPSDPKGRGRMACRSSSSEHPAATCGFGQIGPEVRVCDRDQSAGAVSDRAAAKLRDAVLGDDRLDVPA